MKNKDSIGKKVVSQMIEEVMYGWPPSCNGILYQPERPVMCQDQKEKAYETEVHAD